ncbi:MAG: T9SS type A sorting domain-containing protein [Candidatus Cloacimonetes bacterium]|nr:T9SS type A sorting domain-containing protein [Candidatus Cloacimonadota bacterium]
MRTKTLLMFILLYFGIVGYKSLVAEEKIPVPGEIIIRFENHIDDDKLEEFIADYVYYDLAIIDDWSELIKYAGFKLIHFYYNYNLVEENEFLRMIQADERVYTANHNFDPRFERIIILLNDVGDYWDFIRDYSQYYLFMMNWWWCPDCVPSALYVYYEYSSNTIEPLELLKLVRADKRVKLAGLPSKYVHGSVIIRLQNSSDVLIDEIVSDYSHYDIQHVYSFDIPTPSTHRIFAFNFSLIEVYDLIKILENDERVVWAQEHLFMEVLNPPDPPSSDFDQIIPLASQSSFAYPNPVRGDEVMIRFNLYPSALPITKGGYGVELRIYNIRGQLVQRISDIQTKTDENIFSWNMRDTSGQRVSPGIYFYRITSSSSSTPVNYNEMKETLTGRFIILNPDK